VAIVGGRTSSADLRVLADLADEYGSGRLRTTNTQNLILLDIDTGELESLKREFARAGLDYEPSWAKRGMIACTGVQFCKLAIAETKNRARELDRFLAENVEIEDRPRISVTGCPNSCGQHRICDVGLEGALTKIGGVNRETFQVFLGGGVGSAETISRRIGVRIPSEELGDRMAMLFGHFRDSRLEGETFQAFCARHSDAELAEFLSPSPTPADSKGPATVVRAVLRRRPLEPDHFGDLFSEAARENSGEALPVRGASAA